MQTFSFVILSNLYPHGITKFLSDKWHIPMQHQDTGGNLRANVDLKKKGSKLNLHLTFNRCVCLMLSCAF